MQVMFSVMYEVRPKKQVMMRISRHLRDK